MYKILQKIQITDILLVLGIILVSLGIGINLRKERGTKKEVEVKRAVVTVIPSPTGEIDAFIEVDVAGAVVEPGVKKMKKGQRIHDALVKAGGLAVKADKPWVEKHLNKAELLADGEKIYIPFVGETATAQVLGAAKSQNEIVSLNRATVEELEELPGIGEAMAGRIIEYREQNGGFSSIEEVKLVSGIGEKLFEKIKDKISL